MYQELTALVQSFQNPYLKKLASSYFLEDKAFVKKFCFHSAAKRVHHGFVGGLLEHTLSVMKLCDFYTKSYPALNRDLLLTAALFHDASEILTGDLPTPIKYYNPDIRDAYKQVEAVAEQKLLNMLPEDLRPAYDEAITIPDPHVRDLVKAADKLSAYLKCLEELKAGNQEFGSAAEQTRQALEDYRMPELDYFLTHFLPAFSCTLDQLQAFEAGQG